MGIHALTEYKLICRKGDTGIDGEDSQCISSIYTGIFFSPPPLSVCLSQYHVCNNKQHGIICDIERQFSCFFHNGCHYLELEQLWCIYVNVPLNLYTVARRTIKQDKFFSLLRCCFF